MDQSSYEKIEAILAGADDMTLATIREDGFPQATTVSYVNDGLDLYFGCEPDSQKANNIARNNKVSLTVNLDYGDWREIQGLSMGALAERINDNGEMQRITELLHNKFPQINDFTAIERENAALFRLTPKVVSILDYSQGFGHTELVEL